MGTSHRSETPPGLKASLQGVLDRFVGANPTTPGVILHVEGATLRAPLDWSAGWAERERIRPMRPDMAFRLASNTKTFTAATVLRLVESGKLSLGSTLEPYFDGDVIARLNVLDGVSRGADITLRQLLNHSSGIYDWGTDEEYARVARSQPSKRWTPREQVEFAITHGAPYGPPGAVCHYSDTGYVLASMVIEQVSGTPLARALRELLRFDDLELGDTYLESLEPPPRAPAERVRLYVDDYDATEVDPSIDLFGGGGLVSSVADLARFWTALFAGRVFDHAGTLDVMLTTIPAEDRGEAGLGLFRRQVAGLDVWRHAGFWGSFAMVVPPLGVTVTGFANQQTANDGALPDLAAEVVALLAAR